MMTRDEVYENARRIRKTLPSEIKDKVSPEEYQDCLLDIAHYCNSIIYPAMNDTDKEFAEDLAYFEEAFAILDNILEARRQRKTITTAECETEVIDLGELAATDYIIEDELGDYAIVDEADDDVNEE